MISSFNNMASAHILTDSPSRRVITRNNFSECISSKTILPYRIRFGDNSTKFGGYNLLHKLDSWKSKLFPEKFLEHYLKFPEHYLNLAEGVHSDKRFSEKFLEHYLNLSEGVHSDK